MTNQIFTWPDNKCLAVSLVVNVEEGAEEKIKDGDRAPDPVDELQVIMKKGRNLGNESNYQYGIRAGAPRIIKLLKNQNLKATFTAAALALERADGLASEIVSNGHEVCAHGYRWSHQHWMDEEKERDFIRKATQSIKKTCGKRPIGWLSRYVLTENTRRLLTEEGYIYHMDDYSDDTPRWESVGEKSIVISPYALDTNDMKMWLDASYTPKDWEEYLIDTFNWLYNESKTSPNKMMSVGIHLRIAGRPGRMQSFKNFINHAKKKNDVWFATREEIAKSFISQIASPN